MWKDYEHGKEFTSYKELEKALFYRDKLPIILEGTHDHSMPLRGTSGVVGVARLRPCPEKRGLTAVFRLERSKLPDWLLQRIRRREKIPLSTFQFVQVHDGEQREILFDHVAILEESEPRCPIERCGVGVHDSKMSKQDKTDKPPETPEKPVPKPEQTIPKGESKPSPAEDKTPKPAETPTEEKPPVDVQAKEEEIKALKEQLEKEKEKVAAVRKPLVDFLAERGYTPAELNPLSIDTLQKMIQQARAATTEGLPGTPPAPTKTPLTLPEAKEKEQKRFEKALKDQQEERWKGM